MPHSRLKHLKSNEDDSDVLKEIERVMLEDLSDRYSDQDTLHTGMPRLYIFAVNDFYRTSCLGVGVCTCALISFSLFNQHQHWTHTSKELPLLEVEYA